MPKGGSQPGERRGGRQRGSKNKATIEREERQRLEEEARRALAVKDAAAAAKAKLGKDILEEIMRTFLGMAAAHQPAPPGQPKRAGEDADKFFVYAIAARDTAAALAKYQSPTFRAIAQVDPVTPADRVPARPGDSAKVIDIHQNNPSGRSDARRRMIAAAPIKLLPPPKVA